jgi:hypothetical protein
MIEHHDRNECRRVWQGKGVETHVSPSISTMGGENGLFGGLVSRVRGEMDEAADSASSDPSISSPEYLRTVQCWCGTIPHVTFIA